MYQFSIILLFLLSCNPPNSNTPSSNSNDDTMQNKIPSNENLDMWVNHFQSPCIGEGDPQLCLQIQFGETINEENWEYHYDPIHGFDDYELGYIYHLKVSEKQITTPIASDGSSSVFHLVELVSKEKVAPETTFKLFLKQEGVAPYVSKNEETGDYLLANELKLVVEGEDTSMTLDKLLADETAFNGVFRHSENGEGIVLVGLE